MKVVLLNCLVIFTIFQVSSGLKVLGIFPSVSKSHFALGDAIIKSLHDVGHEVTVISPFPQKKAIANYTDISTAELIDAYTEETTFNIFNLEKLDPIILLSLIYYMSGEFINKYMKNQGVKDLLASKEKFDVCIFEVENTDALMGIADRFDCVVISYTTYIAVKYINDMTGNEQPSSYVPHPFLSYTDNMNFKERFINTFYTKVEDVLYGVFYLNYQRFLYRKHFPNAKKSFDEIYKTQSIIFLNNHASLSSARPYLPNMIEIAGIHVKPAKSLPKDLQEFLDSAEHGVILFSMGSVVQSVNWAIEKREALIKSFSKLKQKVLWKYENDTLPNKPDNVMISKWIPQRDILAHPNVKLFITHGGMLGTTEALAEGVPVLGFPVFGDQKMNIAKAAARGYGLQIAIADMTEETVSKSLNELLNNPKYKDNAKIISNQFNDRPMTPQETVVYWTEYAVRHKGAKHLQAAGNSLNFIQFHLIDVYFIFTLIGLVILYLDYIILKIIIKRIFKKKPADKKLKKK